MKTLIIYDSMYGNTEKVAKAIEAALKAKHEVKTVQAGEVKAEEIKSVDLLIMGSPTQGGKATPKMLELIKTLPDLAGKKVAAFDTWFAEAEQGWALKLLMKTIGYAAPKIAVSLKQLGGTAIAEPEGFIVIKKEGPLKAGEVDRAQAWAKTLITSAA